MPPPAQTSPEIRSLDEDLVLIDEPWLLSTWEHRSEHATLWTEHRHREHCLVWSQSGSVTVEAEDSFWMVAPGLGIWVPAETLHRITVGRGALTYITYVAPDAVEATWSGVTGMSVTGAVRELIVCNKDTAMPDERRLRLQRLTLDLLEPVRAASLSIRLPVDAGLRQVAEAIVADPADQRTVGEWADVLRVSSRTLSRGFVRETGTTLVQWRILVRMRAALLDIAAGVPVAAVARRLGYASPGTFIELFRRTTGHNPAAYFAAHREVTGGESLDGDALDSEVPGGVPSEVDV